MIRDVIQILGIAVLAISATAAVCPDGWTDAGGYCYNFTNGVTLGWEDAEAFCAQNKGHLVVEATQQEHDAFLQYRQSQTGDPVWIGIYATTRGQWSWLSDGNFVSGQPVFTNWKGGRVPSPSAGSCIASADDNSSQVWQSMSCSLPLSFICEAGASSPPQVSGGGVTYTAANYFRDWQKLYQDSTYTLTKFIVNANMSRTRSLASCAVTCTTVLGCLAFNHRRSDNMCQFILTEINGTNVAVKQGWDLWVDLTLM